MKKGLLIILIISLIAIASTIIHSEEENKDGPKFVGVRKCKTCHKNKSKGRIQYLKWKESLHSKAYKTLASERSKKIAKKLGVKEEPQKSRKCLKCHVTNYCAPASRLASSFKAKEGVGCEACHGAAEKYRRIHHRKGKRAEAMKLGFIQPTEATCKKCHNKESPTYKEFIYGEMAEKVLHWKPHQYIGVKKCKTCHTAKKRGNQYGIWKKSPHHKAYETLASDKSKEIAKKLGIKENPQKSKRCLRCHVTGYGWSKEYYGRRFKLDEGVGCEACHGPAGDYRKIHHRKGKKEEARKLGLIPPTEAVCKNCHNKESPTYKKFIYKEKIKKVQHPLKKK